MFWLLRKVVTRALFMAGVEGRGKVVATHRPDPSEAPSASTWASRAITDTTPPGPSAPRAGPFFL
ncbi:hypothetical protein NGM37_52490, partial [Streptomyces sp. TRM76130]|nr:hypothetical protein [Streptomyces sp. TRM76130]